jgi:uncharacterized cupin superfamily protein
VSDPAIVNVGDVSPEPDASDPPGYRNRLARLGPMLDAKEMGASVYELPPGQSICPYHYENGNEEWLLVLQGTAAVRTPGGEELLEPGEIVCFSDGPAGAHKVTSAGEETVRVLFFSTMVDPCSAVYPDSGKIGVWPPGKLFREADAVDYWVGEVDGAEA